MTRDWPELREAVFETYAAEQLDEALGLANEAAARFPEHEAQTAYWRGCLHARLGRREEALDALRTAMEHGSWWSPETLDEDEDFARLHDDPDFRALVAECRLRADQANAASRPELVMLEPELETDVLLLALHGRFGTAADAVEHWRPATTVAAVALPQSSRMVATGAYGWDDVDLAHHELVDAYERIASERNVEQVVLGGFSQGGAAAVVEALTGDELPVVGFVAVAPSFGRWGNPAADELGPALERAAGRVHGYVVTGENDIRLEETQSLSEHARAAGFELALDVVPNLGHEFPPDFAARVPGIVERFVR